MAVANRDLDVTEQRKVFELTVLTAALVTGSTSIVALVPYVSTLDSAMLAITGISGAPTYQLNVDRFIPGAGFTTIIVATGTSNTPGAFGTSGVGGGSGMILAPAGSTLLNLLPNDMLMLTTGGSNAAAKALAMGVVILPIQDLKTDFGFAGK